VTCKHTPHPTIPEGFEDDACSQCGTWIRKAADDIWEAVVPDSTVDFMEEPMDTVRQHLRDLEHFADQHYGEMPHPEGGLAW
jgi:hypothetical protein